MTTEQTKSTSSEEETTQNTKTAAKQTEPIEETTAGGVAENAAETEASASDDSELAAARAEAQKNLEGWQRARAEFANYKKRMERERIDTYENAMLDVMKAVLPAIDDLERAVENIPEDLQDNPWVSGAASISKKLTKLLETYQIEVIDPVGEPFDPNRHQGLGIDEDSEVESGHVSQTLQKGYAKGDKVLRPALVRVAG